MKMVRPRWSEKGGAKKGPWTPEEDTILISYIKEHGPGNWCSIPAATGLLRCGKSCRLRWTNYLKPGIKRGHFTPHEVGMIIHLQASLGNKWTAIATYLPQRTDNDIKNFWNSHLKKKMKKLQSAAMAPQNATVHDSKCSNISRPLQTWTSSSLSSPEGNAIATNFDHDINCDDFCRDSGEFPTSFCDELPSDRGLTDGCGTFDQEMVSFLNGGEEEIVGTSPFSILEDWLLEEIVAG